MSGWTQLVFFYRLLIKMTTPRTNIRPAVRLQVAAAQAYCCAECSLTLGATFHIDHKVALCLGGTNDTSNLCALCPNCHAVKTSSDMQQYWDSRNSTRQEMRAVMDKKVQENREIEEELRILATKSDQLQELYRANIEIIEKIMGDCNHGEVVEVKAKRINVDKTMDVYRARISQLPQERFLEFAGAFITDYRMRGSDETTYPRERHAAVLIEVIKQKGFLPAGFISANKKAGRYAESLPGGLLRPDEEGTGPRARLIFIGGRNHFTGQEQSFWSIQKSDYVYDDGSSAPLSTTPNNFY